jgi:xylan 1,4-beta-xylosidase
MHPENPILSAKDYPDTPFQKTGHADLVQTINGDWYIVFLTGRPLSTLGRCILGRETGIEEITWNNEDWPELKLGGKLVRQNVPSPASFDESPIRKPSHEPFSEAGLDIHFQSLRIPITEEWCSLKTRPGYLRLYGQESLSSLHRQSLIARRLQSFHVEVQMCIDFQPDTFQQMAGLICYYNTYHWIYLHIMGGWDSTRYLQLTICDKYKTNECLSDPVLLPNDTKICLKATWKRKDIQFSYAIDGHNWKKIGPIIDGSILSDDYVRDETNRYRPAFTGAFIGMCCQDLSGNRKHADFKDWRYEEI